MDFPYRISVIIPVFRTEKTLPRALRSLEEQDFKEPFEVLFAYDEGGDESRALLEREIAKHPSYRIIEGPTRLGVGRGRIEAIRQSKGECIAFLDSDDYLSPTALSVLYDAISISGADLVNASFMTVTENEKPRHYPFAKEGTLTGGKEILDAFFADSYFRAFLWTKLIRRGLFFDRPLLLLSEKGDMFEDTALLGSLLPRAQKAVLSKESVYFYDKGIPGSATSVPRKDRLQKHLMVFAYLRAYYEKAGDLSSLSSLMSHGFRSRLSFSYDASLDKKAGASPLYLMAMREESRAIFDLKRDTPLLKKAREELPRRLVTL